MDTTAVSPRLSPLVRTGVLATLVAVVVNTLAAGLALALGVDFELPDGGESIPLPGFAMMTGIFSLIGVALAAGLARWSPRPAAHFLGTTVVLTAISLVPPFLVNGNAGTVIALIALHLIPAAVMIPVLTRSLRVFPARR